MNCSLRIYCANIRSIERHYSELLIYLQNSPSYDIIALSESWVTEEKIKYYPLDGYTSILQAREDGRRSGGVLLYVRDGIKIENTDDIRMSTGDVIRIEIRIGGSVGLYSQVVSLLLVYRDWSTSIADFVEELEKIPEKNKSNEIIIGDMNIDILKEEISATYLNMMSSQGYISHVNEPTRGESCLDHVMARTTDVDVEAKILKEQIADHRPIQVNIISRRSSEQQGYKGGESLTVNITDYKKLKNILHQSDWSWVDSIDKGREACEVNKLFEKVTSVIQSCQEKATRKVCIKSRGSARVRQPWVTSALVTLTKNKSEAYQQYQNNKQNETLKKHFKDVSSLVKKEVRQAKTQYYGKLLEQNKDSPKKYWEIVNKVRGSGKSEEIKEIVVEEETITVEMNPDRVASKFNEYFHDVPIKLLEKNEMFKRGEANLDAESLTNAEQNKNQQRLEEFQLTEGDVIKHIRQLKNKKSVGRDGISAFIIKDNEKLMARVFAKLFNNSIKQGIFPSNLKNAVIIPVHKQGRKDLVENYRPIALQSPISKVFEACVKEKMLNFLDHINFFMPQQHGFRKNKSTDTALHQHVAYITEYRKNKRCAGCIFGYGKSL